MRFISLPDNILPDGVRADIVTTEDGVRLRAACWRPPGEVKGTVSVLHGRAETIEKYFEVVGELLARGFAVATMDWRGQGGSDRCLKDPRKGHVEDFADYDRDLDAFVRDFVLPNCPAPHFALAHSTGGLILLRLMRRSDLAFSRVVLTSPLLELGKMNPPLWFVRSASAALASLGLGDFYPPGAGIVRLEERSFYTNPLTGDARRFARMRAIAGSRPELCIGPPTIGWLNAACLAMREASDPAFAAAIDVPTLVVSAGSDKVVSPLATERFVRNMRLGSEIVLPGAKHEILMERDAIRAAFWAAFDAFIPGTTSAAAEAA